MGLATIISGGTDGLYAVRLDFGVAEKAATLTALNAYILELYPRITAAQTKHDTQQALEDAARTAANTAVDSYVAAYVAIGAAETTLKAAQQASKETGEDPLSSPEEIAAVQTALNEANAALAAAKVTFDTAGKTYTSKFAELRKVVIASVPARLALESLEIDLSARQKDLAYWNEVVTEQVLAAWCADLTDNASGVVATIEIPGENMQVIIAPDAPAPVADDGALLARELQAYHQVFFNAAILPGWQKVKPTYRRGTITAINGGANTADVTLYDDRSSAQNLGINPTPTLSNVPVVYMACHSAAFEVGDRCVIKFMNRDWAQPRIVGFVDHPKGCLPQFVYVNYQVEAEAPVVVGSRPWIFDTYFPTPGVEVIGNYGPNATIVNRRIKIVSAETSASTSTLTGYTINLFGATETYIPDTNHMPSILCVPPGDEGIAHGVNQFAGGLIWVRRESTPVGIKTLPLSPGADPEMFTGGYYSGPPVYTDVEPANTPFDSYMTARNAVPIVRMTHDGRTYNYILDSATAGVGTSYNALKFRYGSRVT